MTVSRRDEWMHLPPEVERLVPALVSRIAGPGSVDPEQELDRIESLLIAGDPERWLQYVRERADLVETRSGAASGRDAADVARLAAVLRDQLVLIQATLELGPEDLALLERLEGLERNCE